MKALISILMLLFLVLGLPQFLNPASFTCATPRDGNYMPVPSSQSVGEYSTIELPVADPSPEKCKPLGLEYIGNQVVNLRLFFPGFSGPVNIYIGFIFNHIGDRVFVINHQNNIEQVKDSIALWKSCAEEPIEESIFGNIEIKDIIPGTYDFYVAVTPCEDTSFKFYYIWHTSFKI